MEDKNLNNTDTNLNPENTSGNSYTGEYGNEVSGSQPMDSTYSYSYQNDTSSVTHSGDYYANQNTSQSDGFGSGQSDNQTAGTYQTQENGQYNSQTDNMYYTQNSNGFYSQQGNTSGGNGTNGNNYYGNNSNGNNFYTNNQNKNQKKPQKPKKESTPMKKVLFCVMCAAIFGIVAGTCFEGVRYVSQKMFGTSTSVNQQKNSNKVISPSTISSVASVGAISGAMDVSGIVEQTMPAVVAITSTTEGTAYYDLFGQYSQGQDTTSCGSGFIVGQNEEELLIVTNNHVIDGAKTISVQFIDTEVYEASVKGTDSANDLAVIAVDLKDIKDTTMDEIKIADLGDSDSLKVGEMAVAIGNALGYGQSVTVGYISAKDREIQETSEVDGTVNTIKAIQTDAAINPGNSGGALLNMQGQVIGINSAKIADSSVEGVGYAIPISEALPIINNLMEKENLSDSEKGYLGISGRTVTEEASVYNMPNGVYVAAVAEGGAADKAGIQVGDIITSIENMEVRSIESLSEKASSYRKGTEVEVIVERSNNGVYEEIKLTVKLQGSESLESLEDETTQNSGNSGYGSGNGDENSQDEYNGYDNYNGYGGFDGFGDFFGW